MTPLTPAQAARLLLALRLLMLARAHAQETPR